MTIRTTLRLSDREYDELKRRQAENLRSDIQPHLGPRRQQPRNVKPLTAKQVADLCQALRDNFGGR